MKNTRVLLRQFTSYNYISLQGPPKKSPVSGLQACHLRAARRHFYYILFLAMKRCPIAAKIARLIGNQPCCELNTFFHIGVWTFARFVRPVLATIYVWGIWSGSNNSVYMYHVFHWLAKIKKITPPPPQKKKNGSLHRFWSHHLCMGNLVWFK